MDIAKLYLEIEGYLAQLDFEDGEHLWTNYETVTGILVRLSQIHNDLAYLEVQGKATPEAKKFRTMIVDSTKETIEKVAAYESRKITAKQIEAGLDK